MLSRLKFIPRDQLDKAGDKDDESRRQEKKRKEKEKRKNRSSQYNSSDEDGLERTKKHSRKKKWYSSDEGSASPSGSESGSASDRDEKGHRYKKREKKIRKSSSKDKPRDKSKKKLMDDGEGSTSPDKSSIMRKELGLDWMLRPKDNTERDIVTMTDQLEEPEAEEVKKANPRELNPYLKNNGTGYPEEVDESRPRKNQLLSSAVVGDGGASWRLKGLKRAQEQAAREGRTLSEVVEERWGSIGELSVSLASYKAAPSRAHLHAIKNRQKGINEEQKTVAYGQNEKNTQRLGRQGVSHHHPEAKVPKVHDSLSWSKRKSQNMSSKDSILISTAMSSINKFANDGSFMREVTCEKNDFPVGSSSNNFESKVESELVSSDSQPRESHGINIEGLSANQLAAKALQLRLKGKHDEADRLSKVAENIKAKQVSGDESCRPQKECYTRRHMIHELSIQRKKSEDDGDAHLARQIAQNRKYSASRSNQADDEYDFDDGLRRKDRKKRGSETRSNAKPNFSERFLTQQERCRFCFENPNRPRHLVIAIANFTYLSLPHWQPVVPSHCCILTLQHESATRAVDDNVWDEIRNFKKCLIMMFSKQEMDVVFLEMVMGLAKQRRHCMVEVIPLPRATAKAAPLYFKKAIDEAEDEWSQHNAKKLIDTSEKGLRGSIPKDFPYFHVEFGLDKGFVHVIDDETQFKSNFGLNIIRGMLQLPEEDMYGRRKHESFETQKQAVASFAKDWQPFDWTKQLE